MEILIPKAPEVFVALLSFLVLFVVLAKFAFPPISKMLDERAERIRDSLAKAEETRIEAERLLDDYKAQMAEARGEAAKIVEQGRVVAEQLKRDAEAKATSEAASILDRAHAEIAAERAAAAAELQASVADISVAVAGKLIGGELDATSHAALIERYLAEVGSIDGA